MHCFCETWNILANMVHAVMLSPVCFYLEEQVPALWFAAVPPLQVAFSVPISLQGCAIFCSILIPPQLDVRLGWRVARLGLFAHSFNHARLQQDIAGEQFLQCLSDGRLRALGNVLSKVNGARSKVNGAHSRTSWRYRSGYATVLLPCRNSATAPPANTQLSPLLDADGRQR